MEKPAPLKPLSAETGFEDSPKHKAICDFIFGVKEAFFTSEEFSFSKKKSEVIKNLVNMTWAKGTKTTRYGYMASTANMVYRSTLDTFEDLLDTEELVTGTALNRGGNNVKIAEELGHYANNILMGCDYSLHLSKRLPYLLTYGHSPAFDTWAFNEGWAVKPQSESVGPGGFAWGREMDVTLNRVKPLIIHPFNVFGSVEHGPYDQPYKGHIKRWTIADVVRAEGMKTQDGKPIYNPKALEKIRDILSKDGKEADSNYHQDGKRDLETSELHRNDKLKQAFVDIVYFRGPISMVDGFRTDPNIYEVECTRNFLLRMTEQPVDFFDPRTDMMTHPYMSSPFGGTYVDPVVGDQRMGDLLSNLTLESIVDSLHQIYTYRYNDITNLEDLKNPKGLRTFLELDANGQAPALLERGRSGPQADAVAFLGQLHADRQRSSVTDQEAGLEQSGKTATESKILLAASSKRVRAGIKHVAKFAIRPQVRNLVYLSLVNQTAEQRRAYTRTGEEIPLGPEHMAALQSNTLFRLNDEVTRNKYEDNLRNSEFYAKALEILAQTQDPTFAVKILRHMGKTSGVKDIDEVIPEPAPLDANPPPMPGAPMMPQGPEPVDFESMLAQAQQPGAANVPA